MTNPGPLLAPNEMPETITNPVAVPPEAAPGPASAPATAAPKTMTPPVQWPPEVVKQFDPVRILGVGGFASVVLARKKDTSPEVLVAIKVAGTKEASNAEKGYAHREIDILKELQHPNIMKVVKYWEPSPDSKTCAAVMALTYVKGPTVNNLIKHGGALSIVFGRVTCAQLCDALAYMHSRAVIHRDIKPDNVIVSGASAKQDAIWDDAKNDPNPDWKALCQKWRVTLVDFGFARALSPDDLEKEKITMKHPSLAAESSQHSTRSLNKSISHSFQRSMSALGNRLYAAPEIIEGVQDENSERLKNSRHYAEITNTFSSHVSNYGMLADAFSLGNTMKYMMTGVPPDQNVNEVIRSQNSALTKLCHMVCKPKPTATTTGLQSRDIHYRRLKDLPGEFQIMIQGTTHPSVAQRTSVRAARRYPFFDDILDEGESGYDIAGRTIHFLHCTLRRTTSTIVDKKGSSNKGDKLNKWEEERESKGIVGKVEDEKKVDHDTSADAYKGEVEAFS